MGELMNEQTINIHTRFMTNFFMPTFVTYNFLTPKSTLSWFVLYDDWITNICPNLMINDLSFKIYY